MKFFKVRNNRDFLSQIADDMEQRRSAQNMNVKTHEFSPEFEKKMQVLFDSMKKNSLDENEDTAFEPKKYFYPLRYAVSLVLVLVFVFTTFSYSCISGEPRVKLMYDYMPQSISSEPFVYCLIDDETTFSEHMNNRDKIKTTAKFVPTYIPNGFVLKNNDLFSSPNGDNLHGSLSYDYQDSEGKTSDKFFSLHFESVSSAIAILSHVSMDDIKYIHYDGKEMVFASRYDDYNCYDNYSLVWVDGNNMLSIQTFGGISKSELFKIYQGVRRVE